MKLKIRLTALVLLAAFSFGAVASGAVHAGPESRQKNKNNWRNLAGAGAAVAGYGLLKGNKTATILGAAGAAYSAKRYEDDRKSQSKASAARNSRFHRSYYYKNGRKIYRHR